MASGRSPVSLGDCKTYRCSISQLPHNSTSVAGERRTDRERCWKQTRETDFPFVSPDPVAQAVSLDIEKGRSTKTSLNVRLVSGESLRRTCVSFSARSHLGRRPEMASTFNKPRYQRYQIFLCCYKYLHLPIFENESKSLRMSRPQLASIRWMSNRANESTLCRRVTE